MIVIINQLQSLELGDCSAAPENFFKTVSELTKLEKLRLEKGVVGENFGKLCSSHRLRQVELIDFKILPGFRSVSQSQYGEELNIFSSSLQVRPEKPEEH